MPSVCIAAKLDGIVISGYGFHPTRCSIRYNKWVSVLKGQQGWNPVENKVGKG
jgi:hypothetical protein